MPHCSHPYPLHSPHTSTLFSSSPSSPKSPFHRFSSLLSFLLAPHLLSKLANTSKEPPTFTSLQPNTSSVTHVNSPFVFDPLLSVQYYSLASRQGEVEADMALSKWFLCGSGGAAAAAGADVQSGGGFEKDQALALTFAEKTSCRICDGILCRGRNWPVEGRRQSGVLVQISM